MRAQKPRSATEQTITTVIVARPTHWSCGQ